MKRRKPLGAPRGATAYQQGWLDCAAWVAKMVSVVRWDAPTRKRLLALTGLAIGKGIAPRRRPKEWVHTR